MKVGPFLFTVLTIHDYEPKYHGIERKEQKKNLKKVTHVNLAMFPFIYNDVFTEEFFFSDNFCTL